MISADGDVADSWAGVVVEEVSSGKPIPRRPSDVERLVQRKEPQNVGLKDI
jgi:hypothetical protein